LDDESARAALTVLHDEPAGRALLAERALVAALGGGCQLPLGAFASEHDGILEFVAVVASLDGIRAVRRSMSGPGGDAAGLGQRLAAVLDADGARRLLDEAR
jgi:hydroxymethylbilane synthase